MVVVRVTDVDVLVLVVLVADVEVSVLVVVDSVVVVVGVVVAVVVADDVGEVVGVVMTQSWNPPIEYSKIALFNAFAVWEHSVESIGYWPSAQAMSSDLPCGPVIWVTAIFSAAATLLHSPLPPSTERIASLPSIRHCTVGAPSSHAWMTLFSTSACLLQLLAVPKAIKFKLYLDTHLPSVSKKVVVGVVVTDVVVVGLVVRVVEVVCEVV